MSEWMGLHNPERHEPHSGVADCIIETANPVMARWCTRDHPCRCCMDEEARRLKAEVEALQAQVQRVRELHAPCLDPEVHNGARCCLVCSDHGRRGEYTLWPCPTIRAIEGEL